MGGEVTYGGQGIVEGAEGTDLPGTDGSVFIGVLQKGDETALGFRTALFERQDLKNHVHKVLRSYREVSGLAFALI